MRFRYLFCGIFVCGLLGGCSTHPLPEDVTGLSVLDIVHKIQCEAADEIANLHPDKGDLSRSLQLAALNKDIENATKELKKRERKLAAISDFGQTDFELADASDELELQRQQILHAISKLPQSPPSKEQRGTQNSTPDQTDETGQAAPGAPAGGDGTEASTNHPLFEEAIIIGKKIDALDLAIQQLRKVNNQTKVIKNLNEDRTAFSDIISYETNNATFQFTFTVTENNDASSNGSVKWPILLGLFPGTMTIGYDVGDKKQRLTERTIKLVLTFGELYRMSCDNVWATGLEHLPRRYPISGDIGLDEVVSTYIGVSKNSGSFKSGGESYFDKIQFTTTLNGSLSPSVSLSRLSGHKIEAGIDLAATRKDVHELVIFLAPPGSASASAPQQIVIKRIPAVRVRASVGRFPPKY